MNVKLQMLVLSLVPAVIFANGDQCKTAAAKLTSSGRPVATQFADPEADPEIVNRLNALMNPSAANMELVPVKTTVVTETNSAGETVVVTTPAQRAEHNPYARQLADFLRTADLTDAQTKAEVKAGMKGVQQRVLTLDPEFASNALQGTMSQLARTDAGSGVANDLVELGETMMDIDPEYLLQAAPTSVVGRVWVGMRDLMPGEKVVRKRILRFFSRFQQVQANMDGSIGKLSRSFDALEKEIEEAYKPDADMLRQKSIEQLGNYALLEALHEEVLRVYNEIPDKTSEKAIFIQSEVLTNVADFMKTVAEIIGLLQQAEMAQLLLIETGESLIRHGKNEVAKAKIGLSSGVIIAAAIGTQSHMARGIKALRNKNIDIQTRNANSLYAHVLEMNGFEIDQSQTVALQANYETYKKTHDARKQAQTQRYSIVTAALPKLKEVRAKMEALIKDQRKGMEFRGQLRGVGAQ